MATLGGNICQNTRCFYYNRSAAWGKVVGPCIKRGGTQCHAVRGSTAGVLPFTRATWHPCSSPSVRAPW
jgi:hypothetical protein